MDSSEVIVTFWNVTSSSQPKTPSQFNQIFTDFKKLDFAQENCEDVNDKLNYNDGRKANPFDKMGNYYGRYKDVFLFNRVLRDKEMRVKIDELLSVKDDDVKTRFFTRLQLYLKRLETGEKEAKGFLGGPVREAFYTGPLGSEKTNLNLNLGRDGALEMPSIYDENKADGAEDMKRLKVHANGTKLMTVLKNEQEQKNYSFTKATSCDMEIKWVATAENNCFVKLSVGGGGKRVTKAMINGKPVKLEELIPLAKQNKTVLIRDKRLHQTLEECLKKGRFDEIKEEKEVEDQGQEKLIVKEVSQEDKNEQVEEFFADLGNNLDALKKEGVKDPLGKFRSDYGRNKNIFVMKEILKDEQLRERMLSLVNEKLGGGEEEEEEDDDKLEAKVDKILTKFVEGEKLAKKLVDDENIDAFFAGRATGNENLNVNITKNGSKLDLDGLFKNGAGSGLRRIKVFGSGQRLLTILKNGDGQRNYSFRQVGKYDVEIDWNVNAGDKSGSEKDAETCKLMFSVSSGMISAPSCDVNGKPVELKNMLELARQNKKVLISGKSLGLVMEKLLEEDGQHSISLRSIGSQEKLTFHGISLEQSGSLNADHPFVKRLFEHISKLDFTSEKPNQFDVLSKYYGREIQEDVFLFQRILRDAQLREMIITTISDKYGENEVKKFSKRMEIYLKRIADGERDAKEFMGEEGNKSFFHGYHVAHPDHKRNIHENLNISLSKLAIPTMETGDNLFGKMIPSIVQEQSELRRVKLYGNGAILANIFKLDGGQRNYDFKDGADCDLEVTWVAKDKDKGEEVKCTLLLNTKAGREIIIKKGFVNGDEVDKGKIVEFAKQNKVVLVQGKTLQQLFEEDTSKPLLVEMGDPEEKWEVLLDATQN